MSDVAPPMTDGPEPPGPQALRSLVVVLKNGRMDRARDREFVTNQIRRIGRRLIWEAYRRRLLRSNVVIGRRRSRVRFTDPNVPGFVFEVVVDGVVRELSAVRVGPSGEREEVLFVGPIELSNGSVRGWAAIACSFVALQALGGVIQNAINDSQTGQHIEKLGGEAIDAIAGDAEKIAKQVLDSGKVPGTPEKHGTELDVVIPTRRRDEDS